MQMGHCFAGVTAIVEYEAEAVLRQVQLPSNFGGFQQQMTEQGLVLRPRFRDPRDGLLWDQKDVRGRLRGDVVEGDDQVVLIDDPGRDFTSDDFLKQGFAHKLVSRAAQNRADSAATAWLLNHQRTRVAGGFSPHAVAEEFDDLVAAMFAARAPPLRAQQPLHATPEPVKANQLR